MSAWLVSNETLSKIANTRMDTEEGAKKFAEDLHRMNVSSLMQRYADDYTKMLTPSKYIPRIIFDNNYQYHKSLSCFLYQCSEGNVPDTALFHTVEKIKTELADTIVTKSSEWDEAKWE